MAIKLHKRMSVEEYLEREMRSETKHEYIDGMVIEMPGGTRTHSKIIVNTTLNIGSQLDRSRFLLHCSEMLVRAGSRTLVYPDLSVVRGQERMEDEGELILLNPVLTVEVTSPSSVLYDHVDKLGFYREIPSLEAYLIISHDRIRADLYTRDDDHWTLTTVTDPDAVIQLAALDCQLSLQQVYSGTELPEP